MSESKKELDLYAILNVPRDALQEEITLAYRRLAVKYHPHRDPNNDDNAINPPEGIDDVNHLPALKPITIWNYINRAYDILTNPLRREIYDRYGERGLREGVEMPSGFANPYEYHGDNFRTYNEVFGSYSPYATLMDALVNPPPLFKVKNELNEFGVNIGLKKKDPPVEKILELELKEIFFGTVKRMKILRREFTDNEKIKTEIREKILIVPVAPGTLPGTRITFKEEGDQCATRFPADVVFIIADKPHELFERQLSNLKMYYQIDLIQALCGFRFMVTTIDNRKLKVAMSDVVRPGDVKIIEGEGLPKPNSKDEKGNLFIKFEVTFPTYIGRELRPKVAEVLKEVFEKQDLEDKK